MRKLFNATILGILLAVGAFAQGGTTGPLTWTLSDGTLTISGNGAMPDYFYDDFPWYPYRSSITSVSIGDGVTRIGSDAFRDCRALTSVAIPNSVTSIGTAAFEDCIVFSSVAISASVISIGSNAYWGCISLSVITVDAANPNFSDMDGILYNKNKTTLIACPPGKQGIVTIPASVTSIGAAAFPSCRKLTTIAIPTSVTSIGELAFQGCDGLTSITIPNSVTSIGDGAFHGCSSLTSVTVDAANANFSDVDGILYNKNKTTLIACPPGKPGIVTIPTSVTSIGNKAFESCNRLTSVAIPTSVTSIGNNAFYSCSNLTSVPISSLVANIGEGAFSYCSGLSAIIVDSANPYYSVVDGILYNKNKTTLIACPTGKQGAVTVPASVTSIGNFAFSGCRKLTSVAIPNSVTSIGLYAFMSCSSLSSVTIPNSITSIGHQAFSYCSGLTSIHNNSSIPQTITIYVLGGLVDKANCTLYVPTGSIAAYQAAFGWKSFANIVEEGPFVIDITSQTNSAVIAWNVVEGTNNYTLIIYSDADFTKEIARFQLDASGNIIGQANNKTKAGNTRLSFTVDGLDTGKQYYYTLTAYNEISETLNASVGDFATLITAIDAKEASIMNVYPNPTKDVVHIKTQNNDVADIILYNLSGKQLLKTRGNEVDLSGYVEGVYLLQINGITKKVVKSIE